MKSEPAPQPAGEGATPWPRWAHDAANDICQHGYLDGEELIYSHDTIARGVDAVAAIIAKHARNQSEAVEAAFLDAVGIVKNCTCQHVDVEVLKRIRAALAQLEAVRKGKTS